MEQETEKIDVELQGPNAELSLSNLLQWMRAEQIPGLRFQQPSSMPDAGHMGAGLAGRTHQTLSSLAAPATISPRKSRSHEAPLRLRRMLSLRGFCFSRLNAILRNRAKLAAA